MRLLTVLAISLLVSDISAQEAAESFGERQLSQVCDDRPSMKNILPKEDVIFRRVVNRFNEGNRGARVYWDHQNPFSGRDAEFSPSSDSVPAFVRITDADEVSGYDKWYMLVFEMENLQNAKEIDSLVRLACEGRISRDAFALRCVELEHRAVKKVRLFFKRYPIVGATRDNAPNYSKMLTESRDFTAYCRWLDSLPDNEYDPREYFGKYFDRCKVFADAFAKAPSTFK